MSEDPKVAAFPDGIDFNQPILNINGNPINNGENSLTLGEVCCSALLATIPGDKADGTQKLKRFNLARKIKGANEDEAFPVIRLNSTQKKLLEELVAQVYSTTVYGRVYEAFEGKSEEGDG